ncbi:S1C family serine protease, partial [Gammaproteobacteria bacterium]|nr:S1C family serine protease [Gammaproteobacteria bacterium]
IRPQNDAVMGLHCSIPETAMTAALLGTERQSHAVQVSESGLMLTVGYSVMEASELWLTNRTGQTAEAILLAHDYDSGIALIRPVMPLGKAFLETAPAKSIKVGTEINILTSTSKKAIPVELFAKEEYAGRWEYLLEEAFYTVPLCEDWSGAALLNTEGKLCGIGSLALGLKSPQGDVMPGNLFIPTELVMPHLEYMSLHGQKPGPLRPWLGTLIDEKEAELHVVGLYQGAPAAEAGVRPGDVILSVDQQPVSSMAGFFRTIWHYGSAGSHIPLTLKDGDGTRQVILDTVDRNSFFVQHASNMFS